MRGCPEKGIWVFEKVWREMDALAASCKTLLETGCVIPR
jgi:hypothetical protein